MITESKQTETNILLCTSPKAMFLSTAKVGTRFLQKYLAPNASFFQVDNQLQLLEEYKEEFTDAENGIANDWDLVFSKKLKKDIVICYRHPYNRLLTAVIQDVIGNIVNPFFNPLLEDIFYSKGYTQEQMIIYYNQMNQLVKLEDGNINIDEIIKNRPIFGEMLQYTIKLYMRYYLNNTTYNFYHNSIYLPFIVSLFLNPNVDTNKIKLINIDENKSTLHQTLKDYDVIITPSSSTESRNVTYSNKSKINSLLPGIINELGGPSLFEHRLSNEMIAYNQLETIRDVK